MNKILIVSLCWFVSQWGISQSNEISGIITTDNQPIIGATIFNTNTNEGTISAIDGTFSLAGELGHRCQVKYLGYETISFTISQDHAYIFDLVSASLAFDEVVVTALGLERKNQELGYSIQKLTNDQLSEVKSANFLNNLSGKLAGVQITQGATGVGSSAKITIRGESSFRNNNPLFVVDGIPINNETNVNITNETASGFQEIDFGNGAMDINPDDIASVSVLKGPSAAALYGTRASNGAIVVTTKDGSASSGLGLEYNTSYTIDAPFRLPKFQNKYGQGNAGEFEFIDGLGGGINDNITYSYGPKLDAGLLISQFDSPVDLGNSQTVRGGDHQLYNGNAITPTPFNSNPDNLKNFYQTGKTISNNLAFSKASDFMNVRLSMTDMQSDSYIPGVNLDRQSIYGKLNMDLTPKWEVSSSFNYAYTHSDNRPSGGYGSENINYSLVAWMGRQTNIESLRDYWQPGLEGLQQYSFNYTFFDNPFLILKENRNGFDRHRMTGNISTTYKMTNKLSATFRSGMDQMIEHRTYRRVFSSNRFKDGAYAEQDINAKEINTDVLINYRDRWQHLSIDVNLGANRLDQINFNKQIEAIGLAQPGIYSLTNAGTPLQVFQQNTRKRINSIYAWANIGYKDYLFLEITGRNDWSSALATTDNADQTRFFYPSISSSLILSKWLSLPSSISFLKARTSWAQVGNDTEPYQTAGVFLPQTPVNGNPTFSDQTFIPNAGLLPEKTTAFEMGADIRFYDDRINLDVTYYNSKNENQILALPIPISSGYTQQIINGGSIKSSGYEITLGLEPIRTKNTRWLSQLNFSKNSSIVENLPDNAGAITLAYSRVYDNTNQTVWFIVEEGDQIGNIWGTGYKKNDNGDFVINDDGTLIVDNTLKKLGNYNPDFILGFVNTFSYRRFQFNCTLDWRYGGEIVSRTQALAGVAGQLIETENRPDEGLIFDGVINVGTDENPIYEDNTIAISPETYYRQYYDRNHEENNVYDASYLKIRECQLSYKINAVDLKQTLLKDIQEMKISLIGRNLFAFSAIPHFDPEQIALQGNQFVSGVEDMSYPTAKSLGISLTIKL